MPPGQQGDPARPAEPVHGELPEHGEPTGQGRLTPPLAKADDPPDCGYSVCRLELTEADFTKANFTDDLDRQQRPIVGFHVTGNCPRCLHETRALFPVEAVVMDQGIGPRISYARLTGDVIRTQQIGSLAYLIRRSAVAAHELKVSVMTCQCVANHQNSQGAFGCGASWLIGATFHPDGKAGAQLSRVSTNTSALWPAATAYATAVSGSLKAVQASAKTWQAALTAILGIVAAVSLVGGRSTLQTLSGPMQAWIIATAGVAVAANAWGIYKSTLASIGFPAVRRSQDALDLSNSDLPPLHQAIAATDNLRAALGWSALSFLAAVVAVGFVWLAPAAAVPGEKVDLDVLQPVPAANPTATVQVPVCGVLPTPQPTGSPASIAIVPVSAASPAPTVTYPVSSVVGIAPGTC
jgi:hypothetical protein